MAGRASNSQAPRVRKAARFHREPQALATGWQISVPSAALEATHNPTVAGSDPAPAATEIERRSAIQKGHFSPPFLTT